MKLNNGILTITAIFLIVLTGFSCMISNSVSGQSSEKKKEIRENLLTSAHSFVESNKDRILATGIGQYLLGNETWTIKAPMSSRRWGVAIGVVNNKIYVMGGFDGNPGQTNMTEEYDPTMNTWTIKAPMPTNRMALAVGVVNNKIYAIGGYNGYFLNVTEEYDPTTNAWTIRAPIPTPRMGLAIGMVNNKIYAIGGHNGSNPINVNEEYDPATNIWTAKAPMPTARDSLAIGVISNRLYAIGGWNGDYLDVNEEYDPATNKWTSESPMSITRGLLAIGVINKSIYAIGGCHQNNVDLNLNEEFDPSMNTWTIKAPMPTPREGLAIGVVDKKIYAIAGSNGGNATEEYDPGSSGLKSPSAPLNLQAIAGDKQVYLSWTASTSDGGSPIIGYRIYRGTSSGGETFLVEIGNVLAYSDMGLINGQTYYYQVTAMNVVGEGPKSNEASATPATTPSEPQDLQADAGNAQVALNWSIPASDGGSRITNYMVYRGTLSSGETFLVKIGNVLSYTDTGLINGQTYYYQVSAVNSIGEGPKSSEVNATPLGTVNQPPIANFTFLPSSPTTDDIVQFTDLSTDPDGTIVSWIWDFGDKAQSTDKNPTYMFIVEGDYSVKLTVTDNKGANAVVTKTISVKEPLISVSKIDITSLTIISLVIIIELLVILLLLRRRKDQKVSENKK